MAETKDSVVVWFEIPATDFDRAVAFYESAFNTKLKKEMSGASRMAVFPYNPEQAISGCIMAGDGYVPGKDGTVIYLNAGQDLSPALVRAAKSGGEILLDKTALPPGMGCYAHFRDSEGNRVGLHSIG